MKRRKCLKYVGTASIFSVSGCLERLNPNDENSNNTIKNPFDSKRVIEPEHDISLPPRNKASWNPRYLGTNMSRDSDLNFRTTNGILKENAIKTNNNGNVFSVRTFSSPSNVYSNADVDYSENFVAVVEKGSSFVSDKLEWVRVDELDESYVLYGYTRRPYQPSTDSTLSSIVSIEESEDIDDNKLYVSLVISSNHQVIFNSEEGVVNINKLS